jgi:hypothetical protein
MPGKVEVAKVLPFDALGIARTNDEFLKFPLHRNGIKVVLNIEIIEVEEGPQGAGDQRKFVPDLGQLLGSQGVFGIPHKKGRSPRSGG